MRTRADHSTYSAEPEGKSQHARIVRDLGLSIDTEATQAQAMRTGRTGSFVGRISGWARSFLDARDVKVQVKVDEGAKVWTTVMRIPLKALSAEPVREGTRWRANFYRIDRAQRAFLAFNPALAGSFHTPARFGWMEFTK